MNLDTTVKKGQSGWEASTRIALPAVIQAEGDRSPMGGPPAPAFLEINTHKRTSGGIVTSASVFFVSEGCRTSSYGSGYQSGTYADGAGDYHRTVRFEKARVTEKKVREFHEESLKVLPEILAQVATHYGVATADDLFKEVEPA
ncbi:hypothetical protein [Erythrobacter aureus]|uniref:Uncharacterized protein n=1 Tax=Erythrobacter aureus TaxID=2182384 RepID=A0A345YJB3_9SPHN|nr:hypothetical protein [Erythrobacter aureus]AXK44015.1 hypothetical protein DVR09_16305 [Erythrobacter aureus]